MRTIITVNNGLFVCTFETVDMISGAICIAFG